jgi:hypothetical protein
VKDYAAKFSQSVVTNRNQSEIVRQRLYDTLLYPTAGATQLTFFSQPVGQGITTAAGATVGSAKTQWDTNLEIPNTLPSGKSYLIESIEVEFTPGSVSTANTFTLATAAFFATVAAATVPATANDVNSFYNSGMLELNILSKNYLRESPLNKFPPKAALDYAGSIASNSATTATIGVQRTVAGGRPYYIEPEITLQPAVNFEVLLRWPAVVATPSGFNARVQVAFDGVFMRASQ